jgi:dTDP-4-dehydrorhamnose reductase
MRRAWAAGKTLRLFVDEFRTPLSARVTAKAIWELAAQRCAGIYHVAGTERLSRWDLGKLVAARAPELTPRLEPASIRDFDGPPRPADCSLDCRKASSVLSFPLPGLRQWLDSHPEEPF